MIHSNKPAGRNIPKETIEKVYNRQGGRCLFQLPGCTGSIQGKPHHWGLHNNLRPNRQNFPDFVHHPANLAGLCLSCHSKRGSGDNLPDWAIYVIIKEMSHGHEITMGFKNGIFSIYSEEILLYQGKKYGKV